MKNKTTLIIIVIVAIIIFAVYYYMQKSNYHQYIDTLLHLDGKDYMDRHRIMKLQYTGDIYQRLKMIAKLSHDGRRYIDLIGNRLFTKYGRYIFNTDKKQIYTIISLANKNLEEVQRLALTVASLLHQQRDAAAIFNKLYPLVHNGIIEHDVLKELTNLYYKYHRLFLHNDRTYILELTHSVYKMYSRILSLTDSIKTDAYKYKTG